MSFYREIQPYYEDIFPVGNKQISFFLQVFTDFNVHRVLDAACGTGSYARLLAAEGFNVTGVDYSEEMITAAADKESKDFADSLRFFQGDMRNLPSSDPPFDAVICIGNSLAHLLTPRDIRAFLDSSKQALRLKKGLVVIQTVNYDRLFENQVFELPTIVNKDKTLRFTRKYSQRSDGLWDFLTTLYLAEGTGEGEIQNSVPLWPLRKKEISDFLASKGFQDITFYGSFEGNPWSRESMATITTAHTG